jgi:hypothetical protein
MLLLSNYILSASPKMFDAVLLSFNLNWNLSRRLSNNILHLCNDEVEDISSRRDLVTATGAVSLDTG